MVVVVAVEIIMRCLAFVIGLLLLGWVSCVCQKAPGSRYRSIDNCPINRMFRPLCASDGCSYINDGALACAQKEDPNLRVIHDGMCSDAVDPEVDNNVE
ncbi:uncharacterized protein LOC123514791 [Portunus trituberculatus]|uniref:uncharacterized protein LOC123514791 n=1 Tax=Portunus trituberculatus TaxID=210409 RepID=UPI001E1D1AA9|nr:uncharacterized protein LOC123514791 [Portunus trituberculatus]